VAIIHSDNLLSIFLKSSWLFAVVVFLAPCAFAAPSATFSFGGTERQLPKSSKLELAVVELESGVVLGQRQFKAASSVKAECGAIACLEYRQINHVQ
jgi:hypothetical protein